MTRRLLTSYVLLAAFILVLVELPLGFTFASRAEDRFMAEVEGDARVLSAVVEEQAEEGNTASVRRTAERYADQTGGRVVVTDESGVSLVDTSGTATGHDFSRRAEFARALGGARASGYRSVDASGVEVAYVAVPVLGDRDLAGALRVSVPTDDLRHEVRENWLRLGGLALLVLATAAAVGWFVARWATRPVGVLELGARRLAEGDLDARAQVDSGPPELRQLAATFNDMAARVEVLVTAQRAFVADASHQLRTPLTALRLRLEALEDRTQGDPAAARDVEAITAELQRLGQMVEALLAIARAESQTATTEQDVAAAVADAVARWEPFASEHRVRLSGRSPEYARSRFVVGGLEQVLDNLIDNAIDASPSGGSIEIGVSVSEHDRRVGLTVRDHGSGLSAESRKRATDRFWRGAEASPGGTGLGLAICAELTRASGGILSLEAPEDGHGLVVRLDLPGTG